MFHQRGRNLGFGKREHAESQRADHLRSELRGQPGVLPGSPRRRNRQFRMAARGIGNRAITTGGETAKSGFLCLILGLGGATASTATMVFLCAVPAPALLDAPVAGSPIDSPENGYIDLASSDGNGDGIPDLVTAARYGGLRVMLAWETAPFNPRSSSAH